MLDDVERRQMKSARVQSLQRASWALAFVALGAGFYIGLHVNAEVGATLWILSAALGLAPFLAHRDKWS